MLLLWSSQIMDVPLEPYRDAEPGLEPSMTVIVDVPEALA
jgi:hypothetical protein